MIQVDIQDTINLVSNYDDALVHEDDIMMMLNMHVRRNASKKNALETDILNTFQTNFEAFRKKWFSALLKIQLEQTRIEEADLPKHLTEYRYSVQGIVKVYRDVLSKKVHRKTINDHMTPDQHGFSKLKKISLPHEYNSVLESDLIEYFYNVSGKKIDPAKIRKYHYKSPVNENYN
ncbi:hypothetical protein ACSX1A_00550 [Pontibacter sp. MBLB2868]|uniref:hypothetical protein n=1 Tax=Pontibacter sp. MBLB2868 TaxID=3451555 RepID=UPI003F754380